MGYLTEFQGRSNLVYSINEGANGGFGCGLDRSVRGTGK